VIEYLIMHYDATLSYIYTQFYTKYGLF